MAGLKEEAIGVNWRNSRLLVAKVMAATHSGNRVPAR